MSSKVLVTAILSSALAGIGIYYVCKKKKKTPTKLESLLHVFNKENCHIRSKQELQEKIRLILEGGEKKLQVLADFDMTLTKYHVGKQRGQTSYGIVEESDMVSAELRQKLQALKAKYYPIEMCPTMDRHEKIPLMVEWWSQAHELVAKAGIHKSLLPRMVKRGNIALRGGAEEFFSLLHVHKIPLLIISAGVGDIIEEVIKQHCDVPPLLTVVANYYDYDDNDVIVGHRGELIHSFNKKYVSQHNKDYFDHVKDRYNLLLLGDTLGDPSMSEGMPYAQTVLRIGFLNDNVESSLDSYTKKYDVVLTGDPPMEILNDFLKILFVDFK